MYLVFLAKVCAGSWWTPTGTILNTVFWYLESWKAVAQTVVRVEVDVTERRVMEVVTRESRIIALYNTFQSGLELSDDACQMSEALDIGIDCVGCLKAFIHCNREDEPCTVMSGKCLFYERLENPPFRLSMSRFIE